MQATTSFLFVMTRDHGPKQMSESLAASQVCWDRLACLHGRHAVRETVCMVHHVLRLADNDARSRCSSSDAQHSAVPLFHTQQIMHLKAPTYKFFSEAWALRLWQA